MRLAEGIRRYGYNRADAGREACIAMLARSDRIGLRSGCRAAMASAKLLEVEHSAENRRVAADQLIELTRGLFQRYAPRLELAPHVCSFVPDLLQSN